MYFYIVAGCNPIARRYGSYAHGRNTAKQVEECQAVIGLHSVLLDLGFCVNDLAPLGLARGLLAHTFASYLWVLFLLVRIVSSKASPHGPACLGSLKMAFSQLLSSAGAILLNIIPDAPGSILDWLIAPLDSAT